MAKTGKVKSCEPRKEFGVLLKEERSRQRGLIRDKRHELSSIQQEHVRRVVADVGRPLRKLLPSS